MFAQNAGKHLQNLFNHPKKENTNDLPHSLNRLHHREASSRRRRRQTHFTTKRQFHGPQTQHQRQVYHQPPYTYLPKTKPTNTAFAKQLTATK